MRRFNPYASAKEVVWESFKSATGIACLTRRLRKGSKHSNKNGDQVTSYNKANRRSYEESSILTRNSFIEYCGERWYDPDAPPRSLRRERPSRYDPDSQRNRTASSVSATPERIVPPWERRHPLPGRPLAPCELAATSPRVSPVSPVSHPSELEATPVTKSPPVTQSLNENGGSASV